MLEVGDVIKFKNDGNKRYKVMFVYKEVNKIMIKEINDDITKQGIQIIKIDKVLKCK